MPVAKHELEGVGGWGESLICGVHLAQDPAALHSKPFSLPRNRRVSCEAGSQLCFLSQTSFMWSLPRVLPALLCSVDSENRGGAPRG